MRTSRLLLVVALCVLTITPAHAELDASLLAGMQARAIGPAGMSGRIAVVAGVPGDPMDIVDRDQIETFQAVDMLEKLKPSRYRPANGASYPRSPLGDSLRQVAMLIKADVGLDAASIDIDGWDSHFTQQTLIEPLMRKGMKVITGVMLLGNKWWRIIEISDNPIARAART